ncbi:methyl-accepting chemotaxis protein [Proteinivorax tanatarense]|uniref:Methyl-accepting chemotaxis protein n=1 Tax=Proteinivorax tanatarense TaxID=1260629 RepID=A0AAU7VJ69_9FIRM
MFKNMKLIHKVVLLAVVIVGINLILQSNFILTMRNSDIERAKDNSLSETILQSAEYEREFQRIEALVQGYAQDFGKLIERQELSREGAIELLATSLKQNPSIVGHGIGFESNAFDQNDRMYRNQRELGSDEQGRFIPYISLEEKQVIVEPLEGYDVEGDGDWYIIPQKTSQPIVTDPYLYPVGGEEIMMFTISYPILNQGRFIGVVTADVALTEIEGMLQEDLTHTIYDVESAMVTESGAVIGSSFNSIKEDNLVNTTVMKKMVKQEEPFVYFDDTPWFQGEQLISHVPIEFLSEDNRWFMVHLTPEAQILQDYRQNLYVNLGVIGLALVLIIGLIYFIQKSIKTPINRLLEVITKVEEGDLTQNSGLDTQDEIGTLSQNFDHMIDKMKRLIDNVKKSSEIVDESATNMFKVTNNSVQSISNVNRVVEEIAAAHSKQSEDIEEIVIKTTLLGEIIDDTTNLIEEVTGIAESTQKVSSKGMVILNDLNEKTHITMERSQDISQAVDEVNQSVENISGITSIIDDIAGQTNLLALNASIEAARAGQQGKGFAVVAGEIRKLAEQTGDATKDITKSIKRVMENSNTAVERMSEVSTSQKQQFKSISESSKIFETINDSFISLKEKVMVVDEKSQVIEQSKSEILEAITNISAVSEETTASTEETTSMMNEQKQDIEELKGDSEKLNQLTDELNNYVDEFKV